MIESLSWETFGNCECVKPDASKEASVNVAVRLQNKDAASLIGELLTFVDPGSKKTSMKRHVEDTKR